MDAVASVEMRFPDGRWRTNGERHTLGWLDSPPAPDVAREFAETALRLAIRWRTTEDSRDKGAWPLRVTLRCAGEVLTELESGTTLHDADTDKPIRAATWAELEESVCGVDGVFELDGRRVYVA